MPVTDFAEQRKFLQRVSERFVHVMTPLERDRARATTSAHPWWPIAVGLAAVIVPTAIRFSQSVWRSSEQSHGPFVLAVVIYLFWTLRGEFEQARPPSPSAPGWLLVGFGLIGYLFGVWTKIAVLEGASLLPIVLGALWLMGGPGLIGRMWFPLLYLLLAVPIPSYLLATSTAALKQFSSEASESLLYAFGYPIARNGVVLTIGSYRLLVADACSGMNSVLSLTAVGLLYIYLMRPPYRWHIAVLVASILPIAVFANIARIVILVLVTYYLGDEAGQGFLHEFAGIVVFIVGVLSLFAMDAICHRVGEIGRARVHG